MKPLLPSADELLPYLRRIDSARYYSNHGPLVYEFEQRLAAHFGVDASQVATASNGTTALSAALMAVKPRPSSKCLLPSWTFVASAAAAWAAHLRPHFVDVSADTWMLDPEALRRRTDLADVGAVMVVSAFGAPVDSAAWDAFTEETGVPVIIDAAASFDTVASIAGARPGKSPIMISFHATKAFGIGEGALIISTDREIALAARDYCNFGFQDDPNHQLLGYNGKLSEYHAAVGLAALDGWTHRRPAVEQLTAKYIDGLQTIEGITTLPGYGEGWVSCYCNIATKDDASPTVDNLKANGIETRRWWRQGVHVLSAYRECSRDALPVTEALASRVVGLPFYHDLPDDQFARVLDTLRSGTR